MTSGPTGDVAPQQPLTFERFSAEDGLSQSIVECILLDRRGFLWLGTESIRRGPENLARTLLAPALLIGPATWLSYPVVFVGGGMSLGTDGHIHSNLGSNLRVDLTDGSVDTKIGNVVIAVSNRVTGHPR